MNSNRPAESFMVLPGMKPTYTTDPHRPGEKRLPGAGWLPNRVRHMLVSMIGEFVGTYLFLFFAFAGTQVANTPPSDLDNPASTATLLYISLAFGFSLAVNVWIFFRISGGLFNPAVSVALALVGAISWLKAALLIISQILGGIAAAGIVSALLPGPLAVRTTLSTGTSVTRGLFIEMLLTAELIFCIFMLAAEKHKATFLAPIGIGLALFIAELAGVFFTGGSLNPARSFGPDVILGKFDGSHWIYWVGPVLGAIVAVLFYRLIKLLEYETANPGADSDGREERHTEPVGVVDESGHESRRTDGANDSDFGTTMHPFRHVNDITASAETGAHSAPSLLTLPGQPAPIHQYGYDGHSSIDHPNDRPRAQHRSNSAYGSLHSRSHSRSQHSHYEEASDRSFRGGPSAESGSSSYSSTSRGSS